LGERGDAATALAEANHDIHAATDGDAKRPANVGSCRTSATGPTRAGAEETVG